MYFENNCKVLLSIDKKVLNREQFANASANVSANASRMKYDNITVISGKDQLERPVGRMPTIYHI